MSVTSEADVIRFRTLKLGDPPPDYSLRLLMNQGPGCLPDTAAFLRWLCPDLTEDESRYIVGPVNDPRWGTWTKQVLEVLPALRGRPIRAVPLEEVASPTEELRS